MAVNVVGICLAVKEVLENAQLRLAMLLFKGNGDEYQKEDDCIISGVDVGFVMNHLWLC